MLLPTDEYEIMEIIRALKSTTSTGWDGIPSIIFKKGAENLARPICHICNLCFLTGTFPKLLKRSVITPVHKSGDKGSVTNYRPISLLPTLAKIVEKAINIRLVNYLESNNLLSPNQFGFREKMSTTDAIEKVIKHIVENLDSKKKCLAIYLDLTKAFDTVSVPILTLSLFPSLFAN